MVAEYLGTAFGGPVPAALLPLVRPELTVDALVAFELSVILSFGGGPTRLAVATGGQSDWWNSVVRTRWPVPRLRKFLSIVAPSARRMVDTADGREARFFLDDLQDLQRPLVGPLGLPLMCAYLHLPSGRTGSITRHRAVPASFVTGKIEEDVAVLSALEPTGVWGLLWENGLVVGAVWVSESRWRGNALRTRALVDALQPSIRWQQLAKYADELGYTLYPDAMEWTPLGWDVTVGLVART